MAKKEDTPTLAGEALKMPEDSIAIERAQEKKPVVTFVLVILILLLLLILVGLYVWGESLKNQTAPLPVATRPTAEENNEPESTNAEAEVEILHTLSTSDALQAIEADVESTNLDVLKNEMDIIENELKANER